PVAPRMPRYCPLCAPKRLPGLPGPVPGPSLIGGLPGGRQSRPLPTPLLPLYRLLPLYQPPVDRAIAGELSDVDKRIVIAGGTISAKRPQDLRKTRRSSLPGESFSRVSVMVLTLHKTQVSFRHRAY